MSALYLWSPANAGERTVEVVVTRGEVNGIAEGTKEFAEAVLAELGVVAAVAGWTVTVFRSKYFSEYLGEDDWRDTWQPVWRLSITTAEPVPSVEPLHPNGLGTEAGDDTALPGTGLGDADEVLCLLVLDFASASAQDAGERPVTELLRAKGYAPDVRHMQLEDGIEQIQVSFGPKPAAFYSSGADDAEAAIAAGEAAGGTAHFEQRPA